MAYINCNLKSQSLMTSVNVKLYFPCDLPASVGYEVKGVITLLHGMTNSGDDWEQMTAASRYAADNGLALIMPDCANSFYQDMVYGGAYKTFITEEMPVLLGRMFKLPTEREKNFIAGLSMGGYGALYLGMSRPDLYAGCASFSGSVEMSILAEHVKDLPGANRLYTKLRNSIFGAEGKIPLKSDLRVLARKIARMPQEQQPWILMTNGYQDVEPYMIAPQNDALHNEMKKLKLAHYKRIRWNGVHEWNFWDRSLVYAIDYFLQNGYAERKHEDWTTPVLVEGNDN